MNKKEGRRLTIATLKHDDNCAEDQVKVRFEFGAFADPLEVQANDQGWTFGDKAELFERLHSGLIINHVHGIITLSTYQKGIEKLYKKMTEAMKPKGE